MTTAKRGSPFVKSADTKASAANSRAEVEKMLVRYGAAGFGYQRNMETGEIVVQFVVPDSPDSKAPRVPVTLPVSVRRVYDRLYGQPTREVRLSDEERTSRLHAGERSVPYWRKEFNPAGYDPKKMEQAERVAWRNLVLWIDAALSAASIGVQTITEAFLAHTMVVSENGRAERMADYLGRTQGALAPGVRALLASGTGDS